MENEKGGHVNVKVLRGEFSSKQQALKMQIDRGMRSQHHPSHTVFSNGFLAPSVCEEEDSQEVHTLQPATEHPFGQRSPSPTASHHRVAPIRAQLTDKQ